MKANQKFRNEDDAVSPVIAVILMVAITVVLAATVYVWVSGFGSSTSSAAKTISLTSGSALRSNSTAYWKNYTIASATSGMKYTDFSITLAGAALSCYATENSTAAGGGPGTVTYRLWQGGSVLPCGGTNAAPANVVGPGDVIEIFKDSSTATMSGASLRLLDSNANSVMTTITIG